MRTIFYLGLLTLFALGSGGRVKRNQLNNYHQPFQWTCPPRKVPSMVFSTHKDSVEDRQWFVHCLRDAPTTGMTYWTNFQNDFDNKMNFTCPFNSVITGMGSIYNDFHHDRRYRFHCSMVNGLRTACQWSNYLNELDAPINLIISKGYYLAGVASYHDNPTEDRRFAVELCEFEIDSPE